ncbi:hypothetical protein DAI22_05g206350 [Oryza sativa Japonica Group]|nr:hypothetical protein DAI22_05g206350 [Oryza sativa Japonica Group]
MTRSAARRDAARAARVVGGEVLRAGAGLRCGVLRGKLLVRPPRRCHHRQPLHPVGHQLRHPRRHPSDLCFVPPLVYAVMGSSRNLGVGPVATSSLLVASIVGGKVRASDDPRLYTQLVFVSALFTGVM